MRRGVLFSLMIFLLIMSILSLHSASQKNSVSLQEALTESAAFRKVSDKHSNVFNNFSRLSTNFTEKTIDERILPFSYEIDGNSLTIIADIPLAYGKIETYLSALNAYRVFLQDQNYQNEYDSLQVDINTLTPISWGGSDSNLSFTALPHCMKYYINDNNKQRFDFPCQGYTYASIVRQDINAALSAAHDFNSISCNFNGASLCFNQDFNSLDARPYLRIELLDANCTRCTLSQKIIRGHFDPSVQSSVYVSCVGLCSSPSLDMDFTNRPQYSFLGSPIKLRIKTDLNSAIEDFFFTDANILVQNPYFNASRWN